MSCLAWVQDEGVYQTVAVNFLNGITDRQQDFAEYHTLSKEQQELFHDKVFSCLVGYDLETEDYPATVYDRNVSPVSGIYHGIPTYASMLAMWGKILRYGKYAGGTDLMLWLHYFFSLFLLCQNLKIRKSSSALACAVFAASPIVVWVEKSALTESFLAVLLVLFLYLLTDEEHPYRQWLSIIPIADFFVLSRVDLYHDTAVCSDLWRHVLDHPPEKLCDPDAGDDRGLLHQHFSPCGMSSRSTP